MRHVPISRVSVRLLCRASLWLLTSLALSSCSNPETQKLKHLERGDQYAAEKRDDFAVIEYASAVELDPKFGEARLKLAETHERMNNFASRVSRVHPRRRRTARQSRRATQGDANFVAGWAIRRRQGARGGAAREEPQGCRRHAASRQRDGGVARPGRRDCRNRRGAQDQSRKQPGVRQPWRRPDAERRSQTGRSRVIARPSRWSRTSVDAKLALANFLWAAERAPEAEATLKEVLAKEPQHLLANRMLGVLYLSTRRVSEAEQPLKNVAEISKTPAARFQLADYYIGVGRTEGRRQPAARLYRSEQASFAEAEIRLAALDYAQSRVTEAHTRLDALLDARAELLRCADHEGAVAHQGKQARRGARTRQGRRGRRPAVGIGAFRARRGARPPSGRSPTPPSRTGEVLRLNPRAVAAQVELSRLSLTAGDSAAALRYAEEARQTAASNLDARVALARSLVAAGNSVAGGSRNRCSAEGGADVRRGACRERNAPGARQQSEGRENCLRTRARAFARVFWKRSAD